MAIQVMIVDDSNFMRKAIALLLSSDSRIEVISLMANGEEALEKLEEVNPDVITLDVNLPGMNGIETLDRIMSTSPKPVIMFSGRTKKGAEVTLKALEKGAFDFVAKPHGCLSLDITSVRDELIEKIIAASKVPLKNKARPKRIKHKKSGLKGISSPEEWILFLASSTGGVQALTRIIPDLPRNFPLPILVVQHMPPMFTGSLAQSLNRICALNVMEAQDGEPMKAGNVYIAPGGWHTTVGQKNDKKILKLQKEPSMRLMPCADVTMETLSETYGKNVFGVVLTGMGDDGTKGAASIKKMGGIIIAQDKESSMIYGMPKSIVTNGLADEVWPLDLIANNIISLLGGSGLDS